MNEFCTKRHFQCGTKAEIPNVGNALGPEELPEVAIWFRSRNRNKVQRWITRNSTGRRIGRTADFTVRGHDPADLPKVAISLTAAFHTAWPLLGGSLASYPGSFRMIRARCHLIGLCLSKGSDGFLSELSGAMAPGRPPQGHTVWPGHLDAFIARRRGELTHRRLSAASEVLLSWSSLKLSLGISSEPQPGLRVAGAGALPLAPSSLLPLTPTSHHIPILGTSQQSRHHFPTPPEVKVYWWRAPRRRAPPPVFWKPVSPETGRRVGATYSDQVIRQDTSFYSQGIDHED